MRGVDSLAPMHNAPLFQHCLIKTMNSQFKSVGMKSRQNTFMYDFYTALFGGRIVPSFSIYALNDISQLFKHILRWLLHENVIQLILGVNWKDLYVLLFVVLDEVPILNVDVLGSRPEFWRPCQLQCSIIFLKTQQWILGWNNTIGTPLSQNSFTNQTNGMVDLNPSLKALHFVTLTSMLNYIQQKWLQSPSLIWQLMSLGVLFLVTNFHWNPHCTTNKKIVVWVYRRCFILTGM